MTAYDDRISSLSPYLWFKFNGSGVPTNSGSASSYSLTETGTGTSITTGGSGISGTSYSFPATRGYYSDTDFATNTLNDKIFTIELWYKNSTYTNPDAPTFVRMDAGSSILGFRLVSDDSSETAYRGKAQWFLFGASSSFNIYSTTRVDDNNWHHIVIVANNGTYKLYVDGNEEASSTATIGTFALDTARFNFMSGVTTAEAMNGNVDEFALYTNALSESDIDENFRIGDPKNRILKGDTIGVATVSAATLPAPSPMIAEINPADILIATASMPDPLVVGEGGISVAASPMNATNAIIIDPTLILVRNISTAATLLTATASFPIAGVQKDNNYLADEALATALMTYAYTPIQGPIKTYREEVFQDNPTYYYSYIGNNKSQANEGSLSSISAIAVSGYNSTPNGTSIVQGRLQSGLELIAGRQDRIKRVTPGFTSIADQFGPLQYETAFNRTFNPPISSYADGFSIELWFKPNSDIVNSSGYIISFANAGNTAGDSRVTQWLYLNNVNPENPYVGYGVQQFDGSGNQPLVFIRPNEWNHIVFTQKYIDGKFRERITGYVNGYKVNSWDYWNNGILPQPINNPYKFTIGNRVFLYVGDTSYRYLGADGTVDEWAIYPKVLDTNDVYRHYVSAGKVDVPVETMNASATLISALNTSVNADGVTVATATATGLIDPIFSNQPLFRVIVDGSMQATEASMVRSLTPYTNVYWDKVYSLNRFGKTNLEAPETDQNNLLKPYNLIDFDKDAGDPIVTGSAEKGEWSGYYYGYSLGGDLLPGQKDNQYKITNEITDNAFGWEGLIQVISSGSPTIDYSSNGPAGRMMAKFNGNFWLYITPQTPSYSTESVAANTNSEMLGAYTGHFQLTLNTTKQNSTLICTTPYLTFPKGFVAQIPTYSTLGNVIYKDSDDENQGVKILNQEMYQSQTTIEIEDGKLVWNHYDYLTKENKKLKGTTNIADGQNHFIVVNRTFDGIGNDNKTDKIKRSCLELYIDGQLELRSYDFNDQIWNNNPNFIGAKNKWSWVSSDSYQRLMPLDGDSSGFGAATAAAAGLSSNNLGFTTSNFNRYIATVDENSIFEGKLSDYIYAPNRPLTGNQIEELWQAWQGIIPITGAEPKTATAQMQNVVVTTNSINALRLYWSLNNLENVGATIEDNIYQVDTFNVKNKTITNPRENFNLNISSQEYVKKPDVKLLLDKYISVNSPGAIMVPIPVRGKVGPTYTPTDYRQSYPKDSINYTNWGTFDKQIFQNEELLIGDRILLINQNDPTTNGVWVYNGPLKSLQRPEDMDTAESIYKSTVYVTNGQYSNTYWTCINNLEDIEFATYVGRAFFKGETKPIYYKQIDVSVSKELDNSCPILGDAWRLSIQDTPRFIDINTDIDISKYQVITFMNYPTTLNEIHEQFPDYDKSYAVERYNEFLNNLKTAITNGKSILINSGRLAEDLQLITTTAKVDQLLLDIDQYSAANDLFNKDDSENYFDTHRNIRYRVTNTLAGLTDKPHWILKDFISYIPKEAWKEDQYAAKYEYKTNGLEINDEFYIPSLPILKRQINTYNFNYNNNIKLNNLNAIEPNGLLYGTAITKFSNTIHNGAENPYKDYITTAIIQPNTVVWGNAINGKIFINLVEDSLTTTQKRYNLAVLQTEQNQINESAAKKLWQYSTSRLEKIEDVLTLDLDTKGQFKPSFSGGGPLIQMPTNLSDGKIRNMYDQNQQDVDPILYYAEENEIYNITSVPAYSMNYLGLLWLGGI